MSLLTSADKAFGAVALHKRLLHRHDVKGLQRKVIDRRQRGRPASMEDMVRREEMLSEEDVERILETRARHGRLCIDCGEITFLLPGQRSANTRCEHCQGSLAKGAVKAKKKPTRVMQTLRLIAGFDLPAEEDFEDGYDEQGVVDYWAKPKDPPKKEPTRKAPAVEPTGFVSYINMTESQARGPLQELRPSSPEVQAEQQEQEESPPRFRTFTQRLKRRLTDSFRGGRLAEPASAKPLRHWTTRFKNRTLGRAMAPSEQLERPRTTVLGALLLLSFAPSFALGTIHTSHKALEMLAWTLSPNYKAMHELGVMIGTPTAIPPSGLAFIYFVCVTLSLFGVYFGNALPLNILAQWPLKEWAWRFIASVIGAGLVYYALTGVFPPLSRQGWIPPKRYTLFALLGAIMSYRIFIGAMNRTWDSINDRF